MLGDIDDTFIMEARKASVRYTPVRNVLRGAAAACALVLVCVGAVWGIRTWRAKGTDAVGTDALPLLSWQENTGEYVTLPVVTYRGAYYEILNMSDTAALDRHGLPHAITGKMVGEQVVQVRSDGGDAFTLYEYADYSGVNQMAVLIAARGGQNNDKNYSYAIFCNFIRQNTALCDTAQKMFGIIGVYGPEDITRVQVGDTVVDAKRFYDLLCGADAKGEDGYQYDVFFKMDEKQQQALCMELADTAQDVRITTKHGFCACGLTYGPKIGYVDWACNHYKLAEPLL